MTNAKEIAIQHTHHWEQSRYSRFLQDSNSEELLRTQVPFYFAVEAFPQLLLKLASLMTNAEARLFIVENIWEEHGQGDSDKFHTKSFIRHLDALGFSGDFITNPFVTKWVKELFELNNPKDLFHSLAAIEYMYAVISEDIATKLNSLSLLNEQDHYSKHSVLDWSHGEEILTAMALCNIDFDESAFRQAQYSFIQLFSHLSVITDNELARIVRTTPAGFLYSRESTNIIDEVLKGAKADLNILTICSGGEVPLHYLSKSNVLNVKAFDANPAQLEITALKAQGETNRQQGRFEFIFDWVRDTFMDGNKNTIIDCFKTDPSLLMYTVDTAFEQRVLNALFSDEATKYSATPFNDHFKEVYTKMVNRAITGIDIHPNTMNILFGYINSQQPIDTDNLVLSQSTAQEAVLSGDFDVIDLSNIGDWMPLTTFTSLVELSFNQLSTGGMIVLRRLLGDYSLLQLPYKHIAALHDETDFYSETVVITK